MSEDIATFRIEGNPGQNNTFVHISHVENYNPNATTVNNTYYGTQECVRQCNSQRSSSSVVRTMLGNNLIDTTHIRTEILDYVSRIRPFLADVWQQGYMEFWEEVINLDVMSVDLYDPGKQRNTNFNRNLVANILHYLSSQGFYKEQYNSSEMTRVLEGDADHPVRKALRFDPEKKYCDAIDSLIVRFRESYPSL